MIVYGLDTEDLDGTPTLYALNSRKGTDVYTAGPAAQLELWRKLALSPEPVAVFCLNLQYDLVNLLGANLLNSVQPFCARKRLVGSRIRGAGHVRFFAIERFLPKTNLKTMGEWVGVKKLELPFDDPRRVARDAKIARVVGERIILELGKLEIPLKYSPISGAVTALEVDSGGKLAMPTREAVVYGKEALYGGRTEVLRAGHWGEGNIYSIDFVKAYGRAMLEELPDYSSGYESKAPKERLYISDCSVEVEAALPEVGALPFHAKGAGLIFPVGTMRGTWTSIDLDQPGVKVLKYHHTLNFPNSGCFLASMVKRLLKVPKTLSPLAKALRKNLYTGLSGKFSQSNEFTIFIRSEKAKPQDYWHGVPFGDWILVDRKGKPPRTSNFVWSAWIQSRNRVWQWKLWETIYAAGGKVFYGDTDDAVCWLPTPRAALAVQESQLLKTKMIPWEYAELLSPKVYRLEGKDGTVSLSTKGVPQRFVTAATVLGEDTITGEIPDTFFMLLKANYHTNALKNRWQKRSWKFRAKNRNRRTIPGDPWTRVLVVKDGVVQREKRRRKKSVV